MIDRALAAGQIAVAGSIRTFDEVHRGIAAQRVGYRRRQAGTKVSPCIHAPDARDVPVPYDMGGDTFEALRLRRVGAGFLGAGRGRDGPAREIPLMPTTRH